MATTAGPAFATAHRMIDGVHADAAVVRAAAEPARAARLAERHQLVLRKRNLADAGAAFLMHEPHLTARQLHRAVHAFLRGESRRDAGRANELPAFALPELDAVNQGAGGDLPERQR